MKVLLTGGAGYIGSHIAVELYSAGHSAVIVDNLINSSYKSKRSIEDLVGENVPFHKVDCRNQKALEKVFKAEKPDAVIHLASLKSVNESVKEPIGYWENNIGATLTLLKVMNKFGCKNLIFSSSATVYGTPKKLPVSEKDPVGIGLSNPYGETKYTIERILENAHTANENLNVTILRYFNPVGAHPTGLIGESPKGTPNNLMPYVARVATGELPHLNIFGDDYDTPDGTCIRDYIHVVDLARGHVAALKKMKSLRIYNLGTGRGSSVLELLHAYESATGKSLPNKIVPRRTGDIPVVYANPKRANRELNWDTSYSLKDACASSYKWQLKSLNKFDEKILRRLYAVHTKRFVDLLLCVVAIPFVVPPMVVTAALVRLSSPGPIIFKQTRIGRYSKPFTMYKFRSMRIDAPHDMSPYEFHDADKYITTIGRIIRKISSDELPQLFNILKGDMSFVGPRPAGINDEERIKLRKELNVDLIRPGLTGWAQVNGRDLISEVKKVELDAHYAENISFHLDLKCILKTALIVFTKQGNVEGSELEHTDLPMGAEAEGEEQR